MRENIRAVAAWRNRAINRKMSAALEYIHITDSITVHTLFPHPVPPGCRWGVGGARIMSPSLPRPMPSQVLYPLTSRTD